MEINSTDYHDFVFQDGKLVGEFEQMYQKARDVPWHQDQLLAWVDVAIVKAIASTRAPYSNILDVGCGLGYFANELTTLAPSGAVYGIDVSPTAIRKLKDWFPSLKVRVMDITQPAGGCPDLFPETPVFDLVVARGLFWYVFPHMKQVVENVTSYVSPGGHLLIHQNFPDLRSQFVGKEVIAGPDDLLGYFLRQGCYQVVYSNALQASSRGQGNDNWFTFFLQKGDK